MVAKAESGVFVEVGGRGQDTDGAQDPPSQVYKCSEGYAEPCEVETMSGSDRAWAVHAFGFQSLPFSSLTALHIVNYSTIQFYNSSRVPSRRKAFLLDERA
jgi:hypothetical protein